MGKQRFGEVQAMSNSASKPWFNGPSVGVGLSLPNAWQGWATLGIGTGAAVMGIVLLHGAAHEWVPIGAIIATLATIHLKRAP